MLSAAECRKEADQCRAAWATARDAADRIVLLKLAAHWDELAVARAGVITSVGLPDSVDSGTY